MELARYVVEAVVLEGRSYRDVARGHALLPADLSRVLSSWVPADQDVLAVLKSRRFGFEGSDETPLAYRELGSGVRHLPQPRVAGSINPRPKDGPSTGPSQIRTSRTRDLGAAPRPFSQRSLLNQ